MYTPVYSVCMKVHTQSHRGTTPIYKVEHLVCSGIPSRSSLCNVRQLTNISFLVCWAWALCKSLSTLSLSVVQIALYTGRTSDLRYPNEAKYAAAGVSSEMPHCTCYEIECLQGYKRCSRLKRPIHSQLKWAILLCDVIPDGKTE